MQQLQGQHKAILAKRIVLGGCGQTLLAPITASVCMACMALAHVHEHLWHDLHRMVEGLVQLLHLRDHKAIKQIMDTASLRQAIANKRRMSSEWSKAWRHTQSVPDHEAVLLPAWKGWIFLVNQRSCSLRIGLAPAVKWMVALTPPPYTISNAKIPKYAERSNLT